MAGTCEASARGRSSAWRITAATGARSRASKRRATDRSTACARAGGVIARVAIATSSFGLRFYEAAARESRSHLSRRPFRAGGGYFLAALSTPGAAISSPPFPRRGRLFPLTECAPGRRLRHEEARRGDYRTSTHDHEQ